MPRIVTFLLVLSVTISVSAQRNIGVGMDNVNPSLQTAVLANKVYLAGTGDTFFVKYDDVAFTRHNYPIADGSRLSFPAYSNPLTLFNYELYFKFGARYLYRFNGTTFFRVTTPGDVFGNTVVLGSAMYFICDIGGTKKLFRYNGSVATEIPGSSLPATGFYRLFTTAGNLYILGKSSGHTGMSNFIKRYNGTTITTLPWSGAGTDPDEVLGVVGTSKVYFVGHERIIYYNGATVTEVFYNAGESINPKIWGDNLYFTTGVGYPPSRVNYLYRLNGATLTNVAMPTGYELSNVGATNAEIYTGNLYISAKHLATGRYWVLRYNGTTFTQFFDVTEPYLDYDGIYLFLRDGNLMIHPRYVNGWHAWEYDGAAFTEIRAPTDHILFPYLKGTDCHYVWLTYFSNLSGFWWQYSTEERYCPPPPGPVITIPEGFMIHDRIDIATVAKDRGWCWNEIIVDWVINPICPLPPPCPLSKYNMRMTDANNGIGWSQDFDVPKSFQIPLPDQQSYKTAFSSTETGKDLVVYEPELVSMGIESVTMNIKPKDNYFLLSVTTRKNAQVPFKATLLNASGKVIWEQTFTAPFSQQITATVQEPGKLLIFSIPGAENKELITQAEPCPGDVLR